jgi:hypothetical protein
MAVDTPRFDGFLGGWLASEDVRQNRRETERANAAYEALRQTYGDVAGDPASFASLEGTRQGMEAHPLQQRQRQANIGQTEQQTKFLAELQPAAVDRALLGNDAARQAIQFGNDLHPYAVEGAAQGVEVAKGALFDADAQRRQSALLNGATLLKAAKDRGIPIAEAFDKLLQPLAAAGFAPQEIQAAREAMIADPTKVDVLYETLTQPPPGSAQAAAVAKAAAAGPALTEADKYRQREAGKLAARAEEEVYNFEREGKRAVSGLESITAAPLRSIDTLLQPRMIKDTFGFSTIGSYLPTSDWRAANNRLTSLKDQIVLQAMQSLKALSPTGSTGFGQLSEREGARLENSLGKLDPYTSEEEGRKILTEVREQLVEMPRRAKAILDQELADARRKSEELNAKVDAMGGGGAAADAPQGLPSPAEIGASEGDEVTGPDGKSYVVQGGVLVPR